MGQATEVGVMLKKVFVIVGIIFVTFDIIIIFSVTVFLVDGVILIFVLIILHHTLPNNLCRSQTLILIFPSSLTLTGSALVSLRVIKHPYGPENAHKVPINYEIPDHLIPRPALYTFRLFMFSGSDFGSRGPQQTGKGKKIK